MIRTSNILPFLKKLPNSIQKLDFHSGGMPANAWQQFLENLTDVFPSLETLIFSPRWQMETLTDDGRSVEPHLYLTSVPNLKTLVWPYPPQASFTSNLGRLRNLEVLEIPNWGVNSQNALNAFMNGLKSFQKLSVLNVGNVLAAEDSPEAGEWVTWFAQEAPNSLKTLKLDLSSLSQSDRDSLKAAFEAELPKTGIERLEITKHSDQTFTLGPIKNKANKPITVVFN